MSHPDTPTAPTAPEVAWLDLFEPVRLLAAENAAAVQRLRGAQIPHYVGMAAACRTLVFELPRALAAQVEADLASGELANRWEAARAAAEAEGAAAPAIAALAIVLRDHGRAAMRHLVSRGKEWTADAYRLEGQAAALEAQAERLRAVAGPMDVAADAAREPAQPDPPGAADAPSSAE